MRWLASIVVAGCSASLAIAGCGGDGGASASGDSGVDGAPGPAGDAASNEPDASDAGTPSPLHVLFIGNSYTYVNDVPNLLSRIAETAGIRSAHRHRVGRRGRGDAHAAPLGGRRVEAHRRAHVDARGLAAAKPPRSRRPARPPNPAAQVFGAQIEDAGAKPTWYVTWARAAGDGTYPATFRTPAKMQDFLTRGYDEEARKLPGSVLACVGEAFRSSLRNHPELVLHQDDNSHATLAGSYLSAATFYVALTGLPVPEVAEVPAGITAAQAAALRTSALVGSKCADVKLEADVYLQDLYGNYIPKGYEMGLPEARTFGFGAAATAIPARFVVRNDGELPAGVEWSLTGPYAWSGGAFPGLSAGSASANVSPCSKTLAPLSSCMFSVSYTAASSDAGSFNLALTDAYDDDLSVPLAGTAAPSDRALLTVSLSPGLCGQTTPGHCQQEAMWPGPSSVPLDFGKCGPVANVVVANRGGAPTTSVTALSLDAPLVWGQAAGFPGGSGLGTVCPTGQLDDDPSATLPYCSQIIAPGERCLVGVAAEPNGAAVAATIGLAYSDALGPAAENATLTVGVPLTPPSDGGLDASASD